MKKKKFEGIMEDYFIISESYYGQEICGRVRDPVRAMEGHASSYYSEA